MCDQPNDALILGLVGQKRVGKDTFADYLVENYGFVKLAFADPIKQITSIVFNLDYNKLESMDKEAIMPEYGVSLRKFYQIFGTELMRNDLYNRLPELAYKVPKNYIWINNLFKKIDKYREKGYNKFIISDVRFMDELNAVSDIGGKLIKIVRPDLNTNNVDNHSSETTVNQMNSNNIDCEIKNEGNLEDYQSLINHTMRTHFPNISRKS